MRPKDLVSEQTADKQCELADIERWGLLLHCLDCYEIHQDLRSIETKVIGTVSPWLEENSGLLTEKEKTWCEGIADQDAEQANGNENVRRWSKAYAEVTVVLRKLLVKKWNSENFSRQLAAKRGAFEAHIHDSMDADVDWTLVPVRGSTRYGALEQTLSPLDNPNTPDLI